MRERPQTYALTLVCSQRLRVFQRKANAELFLATLFRYRDEGRFLLHAFVVMPDHVHLVLSPSGAMEQAIGLIKGGFSFAVRKQYSFSVWQDGYYVHRVLNEPDYDGQVEYIAQNPARKRYEDYVYVHTRYMNRLDPKPGHLRG